MEAPAPSVAVVGAGPAGLAAAERLAGIGFAVTVYERMPSPARKLLMAGRGGLNLTHSEPLETFLGRYGATRAFVEPAIRALPPADLVGWAQGLGQETFVGTSGRVFPKALKASPLLRAWLARLSGLGVRLATGHRWMGWDEQGARFALADGTETCVRPDATLLALGGASWPKLGSDAAWVDILRARGVTIAPLQASNCGVRIDWSPRFLAAADGAPLKRIALTMGGETRRGEVVVTQAGLEGGAVYALGAALREALQASPTVPVTLDLKPDASVADVAERLAAPRGKQSLSNHLRKRLSLPPAAIALINEVTAGRPPSEAAALAALVKAVPLTVHGLSDMDRAISSAGGIAAEAVDARFMLRALPGVFVAGEMLDWDAPTGGYLLQACFATGAAAADGIAATLKLGELQLQ